MAPCSTTTGYFVTPIKPPSPVFFNVTVDPHKVEVGTTADIEVTLKLNDKPANGAAVQLAMLFTPGNDYSFTPDNGVTDANGVFNARVRVSKNAGDSIIAATSGVFSDQDHVTGHGRQRQGCRGADDEQPGPGRRNRLARPVGGRCGGTGGRRLLPQDALDGGLTGTYPLYPHLLCTGVVE